MRCLIAFLTFLKVLFLCSGSFGEVVSSGWSAGRVAQKKFSEVEKWQISKFESPRFEALNAKVLSRSSYVFSWAAESSRPLCRCSPLCCRCRKAIGQGTFAKQIPVEKKIGRISSCSFLLKLLLPKIYSVFTGSEFQPLLMKIAPPDGLASTFKPA